MRILICFFMVHFCSLPLLAESTKIYNGTAQKDGKVIYTEKHFVTHSKDGVLLRAKTEYKGLDGSLIATLSSDFTTSLTSPTYEMIYAKTGNREGIRRDGENVILFDHVKGKEERSKVLGEKVRTEKILMGCQGFNYYIVENMDKLDSSKPLPVRLLIPGRLDYYDFRVKNLGPDKDGNIDFELSIDTWIIRVFASSLYVKYDKKTKRLLWYKGLSNITDANGDLQNVEITYSYENS